VVLIAWHSGPNISKQPRFKEWVEREQMAKTTGLNEEEMDDTTRKAYETVKKIADSSTDMRVRQILQNEIALCRRILKTTSGYAL